MSSQAYDIKPVPESVQDRQYSEPAKDLWALVPAKKLTEAKQRLAACLGAERESLTIAMFTDVVTALKASVEISNIAVITSDPKLALIAKQQDLLVIAERGSIGLNEAIDMGIEQIRKLGGCRVAIIPSDIPLLTGDEFDRVVRDYDKQTHKQGRELIGISSSADKNGTNCLFINTQQRFTLNYGPGSYKLHSDNAEKNDIGPVQLHSKEISMDIDEPQDLNALLTYCELNPAFQKTATWRLLSNINLN